MSIADAERFADDLKNDKKFLAEATAKAAGLASMVELGRSRGYSFTVDELKQVARARSKHPLTDHQLEQIAGGQGTGGQTTPVTTVSTSAAVAVAVDGVNTVSVIVTGGDTSVVQAVVYTVVS